jgi:SNF2 family DNA or RNA helicase
MSRTKKIIIDELNKTCINSETNEYPLVSKINGMKKNELESLIRKTKETNKMPVNIRKKRMFGAVCENNDDLCRSKKCVQNKCVKRIRRKTKRIVKPFKPSELHKEPLEKVEEKKCKEFDNVVLKEHQTKVVDFMMKTDQKGVLLYHGLGSGKTISAISIARCLLTSTDARKVIIITPTSVVSQFQKEILRVGMPKEIEDKFRVYSFQKWLDRFKEGQVSSENSVLVVDEAHNFNTQIKKDENGEIKKGKYNAILLDAAKKAVKIVLLSGTPSVNYPIELQNYTAIIKDEPYEKTYSEYKAKRIPKKINEENKEVLSEKLFDYTKMMFSYFKNSGDIEHFPKVREHETFVEMKENKFYDEYMKIESNELKLLSKKTQDMLGTTVDAAPFYNGVRRAVNGLSEKSPKIEWLEKNIKSFSKKGKILIYSNWVNFGINIIKAVLEESKISFDVIEGKTTPKQRTKIVSEFNSNQLGVLLITSAGGEGLDLKEVRTVILLEPFWHPGRVAQVKGRAVRYDSHKNLDLKDRTVDIYNLYLKKPSAVFKNAEIKGLKDPQETGDEYLIRINRDKSEYIKILEDISYQNSIENDSKNKTNPFKGATKAYALSRKINRTASNTTKLPRKSRVVRCNNRNPKPIDGKCPIDKPNVVTMNDGLTKCCYKKVPKKANTPKVSTP